MRGIRGRVLLCTGAAALVVAFTALLQANAGGPFAMRVVDDLGQLLAAALGSAGCWWRVRRCGGRWRSSWALLGAGLACWAAGESVWSYYELVTRRQTPFPSLADLGFLLFPVLALVGLLVRPSAALRGRGRFRVVLDGAMVAGSLFTLSWATSLGTVYQGGGQDAFGFLVSLAYPASDLLLITVAVSILAHARLRSGLPVVVAGLAALAVADSGFSYLTTLGTYRSGSVVDVGWFTGFLVLGLAAIVSEPVDEGVGEARAESPVFLTLPYVVVLVGGVAEVISLVDGRAATVTLIVQAGTIVALLVRQLLTVLDNRRLVLDVIAQQSELRFRAFHDALTGLANRALFYDRVAHALELQQRELRPVTVLFCDLDDFKSVNDSLGHQAGDALLVTVAERLGRVMSSGDTVARLGGDEFAVLLEHDVDVAALCSRILAVLGEPVDVAGRLVTVRASIGTARADPVVGAVSSQELLMRADIAMYAAKEAGKGVAVPFSTRLVLPTTDLDQRTGLAEDIGAHRVQAAFQPIVRPDGGEWAFEALARWSHGGVEVSPARFIALADSIGLLRDLDLIVVRRALDHAAHVAARDETLVSVNLGRPTLHDPHLPERLLGMLDAAGVARHRLIVEVPETLAIEDPQMLEALMGLRVAGFGIAVDDFGIGYSNLARMGRLAPDVIKLDKSLIGPVGSTAAATRLVAGMIDLSHDLGAVVIAEGVETRQQRDLLRELGCDALQGHLTGRPTVPGVAAPRIDAAVA